MCYSGIILGVGGGVKNNENVLRNYCMTLLFLDL